MCMHVHVQSTYNAHIYAYVYTYTFGSKSSALLELEESVSGSTNVLGRDMKLLCSCKINFVSHVIIIFKK